MKKYRITALFAAFALFLSGCSQQTANIIHADGQDGFILEQRETVTAAELPDYTITTADEEATSDEASGESSETEDEASETAASEETEPVTAVTEATTAVTTEKTTVATTTAASATEATTVVTTIEATTVVTTTEATTPAVSVPSSGTNSYRAVNYSEVKGVWISYIELSSVLTGKSKSQFTAAIKEMYQNCVDMGLNTVFVHARSHGDAYYKSDLYPWSKYVTGTIGNTPDYDPFAIMVEQAHAYGLSIHAWINPLRLCSDSEIGSVSAKYAVGSWYQNSSTRGKYVVKVGSYWYLNPAYEEVTDLIAAGAAEIVAKYNVDGLHIDDYFYPTTDTSFDADAFSASGYSSLSTFRLSNCDRLVSSLYKAVKGANSTAWFGVSTQGNIDNNYTYMYADVKKWCSNSGYVDYMAPQIYYGFKNSALSFTYNLSQWQSMVSGTGIKLIPGLAVYKVGNYDQWAGTGSGEWQTDTEILKRQIVAAREAANYGGVVFYSYNYLFEPTENQSAVAAEKSAVEEIL